MTDKRETEGRISTVAQFFRGNARKIYACK